MEISNNKAKMCLGRAIASYMLLGLLISATYIEAASVSSEDSLSQQLEKCSVQQVQQILAQATDEAHRGELASQLYELCNDEFLTFNTIDPEVKETIDTWLEMDLTKASGLQLLSAYQKALTNPNPLGQVSENFNLGCKSMVATFDQLRDVTTSLADYIKLDSAALLGTGEGISDSERAILNYAMYTQICDSMMGWFSGESK